MRNFIKIILLIAVLLGAGCNEDNKNTNALELETKILKLKTKLSEKESKIQELMNELSTCKASKVKYIETKNDYTVIKTDLEENENLVSNRPKTNEIMAKVSKKRIEASKKNYDTDFDFVNPDKVTGSCKLSDIARVFHNLKPYFKKCFRNTNTKRGHIGFVWEINSDGQVENIKTIKNNIYNKNLTLCLKGLIKKGRYNSPQEGICKVEYIFER